MELSTLLFVQVKRMVFAWHVAVATWSIFMFDTLKVALVTGGMTGIGSSIVDILKKMDLLFIQEVEGVRVA